MTVVSDYERSRLCPLVASEHLLLTRAGWLRGEVARTDIFQGIKNLFWK